MQPQTQDSELQGWQWLVGTWATEATHPALPGTLVNGQATFEWLEDQRFLLQRSHYDHPEIPDAIAISGIIDGKQSMHYFDPRGVHRVFAVDITAHTWRFWNDAPGFSQRFTGTLSDDGNAIDGQGELSRDGATWERDLAITSAGLAELLMAAIRPQRDGAPGDRPQPLHGAGDAGSRRFTATVAGLFGLVQGRR